MQTSLGYILRTRPYTDASVIVDLYTKSSGRLTCITRPSKLRGKVQKGHLQAFRILQLHWQGRSDLSRLTQTDERFRHRIPAGHLLFGLYLNELLLKLVQTHSPMDELFTTYQHTLQLLCDTELPMIVVMRFELALLEELGHMPDLWQDDDKGEAINSNSAYCYGVKVGLYLKQTSAVDYDKVPVSGRLLIAIREPETMSLEQYQELRQFLDALWMQIVRKPFNSRKLIRF
jgi:DNA repair protein RecO (recombination protein O)